MSVIETWRALEARLQRGLLNRGIALRKGTPDALIRTVKRTGILSEPTLRLLQEVERQWRTAISTEPLSKEAAQAILDAARQILGTIPLPDLATQCQ